ncbi:MAG: polyketide cyclase [Rhizobiales bacterium PAR1]|nr:MAG: polyketide cyclase [Rhizobiales bacterium PAR1]
MSQENALSDNVCNTAVGEQHELVLSRTIEASPAALFRCWAEPELMKQWFTPRPWTTPVVEIDVRSGGASYILMRGPNGEEFPNRGVYLEVVPNERIVFTDAYTSAWELSGKPFFTGIITFTDAGDGKTIYTARARHWSAADCEQHEKMGFHEGWGKAADQLEAVASQLMQTAG